MHHKCKYIAQTPGDINKTKLDYRWLLPAYINDIVEKYKKYMTKTNIHWVTTKNRLTYIYNLTLAFLKIKSDFTMRSVRCWYATDWIMTKAEYILMDWKPFPPNPCQHESDTTTLKYYARDGAQDQERAFQRCLEKYPISEMKSQLMIDAVMRD